MLPYVDEAERQRHERRLERDRRRREQGKPVYFETDATLDSWPIAQDPAERSTAILRPRRDPDRSELIELEAQALDAEGQAAPFAAEAPVSVADEEHEDAGRGLASSPRPAGPPDLAQRYFFASAISSSTRRSSTSSPGEPIQ